MIGRKKARIDQLESELRIAVQQILDLREQNARLKVENKAIKNTISLVLHAPLPAVVAGKKRVNEVINNTLLKRAHSHH